MSGAPTLPLHFERLAAPAPWEAFLLPVAEFPPPLVQLDLHRTFFAALATFLLRDGYEHEVFEQSWKLSPQTGADILQAHLTDWSPDLGWGIWPNRSAPSGWTEEGMVNAAAAVFSGTEPAMPNHRLLRLMAAPDQRLAAAREMRGFGTQIECFSRTSFDQIFADTATRYLPSITDRRFRKGSFYLPLLDATALTAATTAEELTSVLCGVEVYLRESAEDQGVLLLAQGNLGSLLEKATTQEHLLEQRRT